MPREYVSALRSAASVRRTSASSSSIRASASVAGEAVELGRVAQVLAAGHAAVEPDVVGQVADLALDAQRLAGRVEAHDADDAPGRLGQAEQHQDGRRLAGAVGPEQAEHLAGPDREVERLDGGEVAVLLGQAAGDDDRVVGHVGEQLAHRHAAAAGAAARAGRRPWPACAVRRRRRGRGGRRPAAPSPLVAAASGGSRPDVRRTGASARRSWPYRRPYVRKTQYRPANTSDDEHDPDDPPQLRGLDADADRHVVGRLGALGGDRQLVVARDRVRAGRDRRGHRDAACRGRPWRRRRASNSTFQPVGAVELKATPVTGAEPGVREAQREVLRGTRVGRRRQDLVGRAEGERVGAGDRRGEVEGRVLAAAARRERDRVGAGLRVDARVGGDRDVAGGAGVDGEGRRLRLALRLGADGPAVGARSPAS